MTGKPWRLVFPEGLFQRLSDHLFPGDGDEHGAVLTAGIVAGRREVRLLVRDLHLARDGIDYVPGKRGYRMLKADFIRDRITQCRDEKLVYLAVHNHGGRGRVAFSSDDLASHERGYPALLDIAGGVPVGALVLAEDAMAGDIWLPDGKRIAPILATIVGARRTTIRPAPCDRVGRSDGMFDRQTRLFGDTGQDILRSCRVGIIGLGGVGSLVAEYLTHLGVGGFVLIDPDRIALPNLPRVVGARRRDTWPILRARWMPRRCHTLADRLSTPKTTIARRVIKSINRHAEIEEYRCDVVEPKAAAALLECEYLFLAADTMRARLLFNQIVHQHYIPGVQIGSKIIVDRETGNVTSVFSVARTVTPECGCLWCNQIINPAKLQEEACDEEEAKAQRYIDEPEVIAPSVITLNAIGAAHAVNDFLFYVTGLRDREAAQGYKRVMPQLNSYALDLPRKDAGCPECSCSTKSRLGRGDARRLQVRTV